MRAKRRFSYLDFTSALIVTLRMEIDDDDLGEEPTEEDLYAFGLDKMPRNNSSDEIEESASYIQPSLSGSLIETASLVLHTAATRAGNFRSSFFIQKNLTIFCLP